MNYEMIKSAAIYYTECQKAHYAGVELDTVFAEMESTYNTVVDYVDSAELLEKPEQRELRENLDRVKRAGLSFNY